MGANVIEPFESKIYPRNIDINPPMNVK